MKSDNSIILSENDKVVDDPKEVTEIFSNFLNVAMEIKHQNRQNPRWYKEN